VNQNEIRVRYTRGGRALGAASFTLTEARETAFGRLLQQGGLTAGLGNEFEVYVSCEDAGREISAHNSEDKSLESVLMAASEHGDITGKSFVIDCTAEHRGAGTEREHVRQ
jgi:hypothetical protein